MSEEKTNLKANENSKDAEERLRRFFEESKKKKESSPLATDQETAGGAIERMFAPEKQTAKETVSAESDSIYNKILSKVKSSTSVKSEANEVQKDADDASKKASAEEQVAHLVELAMVKNVHHAVKVARYLEDNYVLDKFRDSLIADELHDALVKKELI